MNILGHITIGIAGTIIMNEPMFLLGSLIPDLALIPNELRFKRFDKWNVRWKFLYDLSHSLIAVGIAFFLDFGFGLAYMIHVLVDIPFHTSAFRWKPFAFNRYKSKRKALLLSGGMDSVACALLEKDFDCIYFNYGQEYHDLEFPCAQDMAKHLKKDLIIINKEWKTDIQNRNYYFIAEIKRMGYDEVIIGTRNLLPLFDKYKDSNWFNMKLYQYLVGIYINMPLIGNFKFQVKQKLGSYDNYYSTETN